MQNSETILEGHTDLEKGAYLGAIASIATADREASEEEIEYITALCDSANLSPVQKQAVIQSAKELTGEDLNRCLDVLKNSDLKYSLLADLMAFAQLDKNYSEEEKQNVQHIAQYLQINQQQYSLLNEFTQKTSSSSIAADEIKKPDFLSSLGLKDKLKSAGIDGSGLLKGLLSIAGPIILAKLVSGGLSRNRGSSNNRMMPGSAGGLGSIISMLSGGRGLSSSTGGLFSRIFNQRSN